jgi:hypothetical protein
VDAYCESCGRHPGRLERARGRGVRPCRDACGLYVCPDCEHADPLEVFPYGPDTRRQATGAIAVAVMTVSSVVAVGGIVIGTADRPGPTGAVLGARQAGPGASATPVLAATTPMASRSPSAVVTVSPVPSKTATPTPAPSSTGGMSVGQPAVRTWRGALGELRLQVIVAVKNEGSSWMRLTRSASTYEVYDRSHRTIASGIFTAALPEVIPPAETAYLVDTLSVVFGDPKDFATSKAKVTAIPAEPPDVRLSITSVDISTGEDHGLRAIGEARNDGDVSARSVVAGVVVLDQAGQPISAVYDLSDIGQLGPRETGEFDTEYPGAPPVDESGVRLVRYCFTSGD